MPQEPQSINRARDISVKLARELADFDFNAPAELYPSRSRRTRGPVAYKRFDSAAEALRFAVEELPEGGLNGATLEVNEARVLRRGGRERPAAILPLPVGAIDRRGILQIVQGPEHQAVGNPEHRQIGAGDQRQRRDRRHRERGRAA